jgi:hypothetical protein
MVDTWFLMGSPMPMLGILASYVSFVLKIGPTMMASRKPFNLQPLFVAYNFSMILLSLYLAVMVSRRISLVSRETLKPMEHIKNVINASNNFLCPQNTILSLESVTEMAAGLQNSNTQFFASYNLLQFNSLKLQINAYVQNKKNGVYDNTVYRRMQS